MIFIIPLSAGTKSIEFLIKFPNTWLILWGSQWIFNSSLTFNLAFSCMFFLLSWFFIISWNSETAVSTRFFTPISCLDKLSLFIPSLYTSKTSSTNRSIVVTFLNIDSIAFFCFGFNSPAYFGFSNIPAYALIGISGVLISWLTIEMNSSFAFSEAIIFSLTISSRWFASLSSSVLFFTSFPRSLLQFLKIKIMIITPADIVVTNKALWIRSLCITSFILSYIEFVGVTKDKPYTVLLSANMGKAVLYRSPKSVVYRPWSCLPLSMLDMILL